MQALVHNTAKSLPRFSLGLRRIVILIICALLLPGLSLHAQTFAAGNGWYSKGNFAKAEVSFNQALKSARTAAEKARLYKYIGICQYMLRKTALASQSFNRAMQIVPSTSITSNEVLDESVIRFFNQQRGQKAAATNPAPQGGVSLGTGKAVLKTTYLRVTCNVRNATVLLDGILAGNAGEAIEVKAGVIEIQLNAPGYLSKKARIQIVANRENNVNLQLEKPKPKPQAIARKPAAKRSNRQNSGDFLPDPGTSSLFDDTSSPAGGGGNPNLGGRDLQSEFAMDANTGTGYSQPPPMQQPQYMQQQQPYPMYQQQPMMPYQQPMYAAPMYPTQPYAPAYPAPYPQPYAQPYAPPYQPQYAPPVSQPYGPAMPPPAMGGGAGGAIAAPATTGGDPGYYQDSSESFLPPVKKGKSSSRKSKLPSYRPSPTRKRTSSAKSSGSSNILITILPFGAGQFQNKSYILGSVLAGTQLGALGWAWKSKTDGDALYAEAVTYLQENPNDSEYRAQADAAIEDKRKQQNYATFAFVGLWIGGVTEAIINEPKPKVASKKRRRAGLDNTQFQRYALLDRDTASQETEIDSDLQSEEDELVAQVKQPITLDLKLLPYRDVNDNKPELGIGLVAGWKF